MVSAFSSGARVFSRARTPLLRDTAGQERFHTITPHYYRNASIILVMYDVTSVPSFDGAQRHWLPAVDEVRAG